MSYDPSAAYSANIGGKATERFLKRRMCCSNYSLKA
jgi:hypothetical protein